MTKVTNKENKTKKAPAVTSPRVSILPFIEIGIIVILTVLKSFYFYRFIGAADYSAAMTFATAAIMLGIFIVFSFFKKFSPIIPVFAVYTLMSLLMFADRLFASYFNGSLPKIVSLKLLGLTAGVGDSITAILEFSHFLYIIDLLVFVVYFIFRKKIAKAISGTADIKHFFKFAVISVCILFSASAFASYYFIGRNGGYYGCLKNEIFVYHFSDLYNTVFPDDSGSEADPSEYFGKVNNVSNYEGIAKGKNLINIQIEALNEYPIGLMYEGQEITPNLNKLLGNDTIYFDNYYWCNIGGGGTSDAEFMAHNSLYPPSNLSAYMEYGERDYYGLPFLLKDNGFSGAYVFHGYGNKDYWNRALTYPGQGFDRFINGTDDFDNTETIGLGISDSEFFRQSVEEMVTFKQPFYAFLITLSSHHPYDIPPEYQMLKLNSQHDGTMFGNYLQSMRYADEAIGEFFEMLKENGLYENSVITLYGDHYGLNTKNDDGLTSGVIGEEYTKEELFKIPLFIHIPGSGINETVSTTGSHMDYTPTILSLYGINNNRSIMFGQNLLAEDTVGKAFGQNHMCIGGFINDEVIGELGANGLKVFDKVTNEELDPTPYQALSDEAISTLNKAHYLLETNQIRLENFK